MKEGELRMCNTYNNLPVSQSVSMLQHTTSDTRTSTDTHAPKQTLYLDLVIIPPRRRLDANLLSEVPAWAFRGVRSLRHLWLDDNSLTEIPLTALDSLPSLQAMTLALNQITHIPDNAFKNLSALVVL